MPQIDTLQIRNVSVLLTSLPPLTANITARQIKDEAISKLLLRAGCDPAAFRHTKDGKPFLTGVDVPHISISHTATILALAVSDKPIGIDIEVVSERTTRVISRILTPNEKMSLLGETDTPSAEIATAIWTTKEAVFKLYSPLLQVITQIEISTLSPTLAITTNPYPAHVDFVPYQDHLIALATHF